jgi:hypothetical protein
MAKQLKMWALCCFERLERKTSPVSPVELQYLIQCFQALEWFSCVPPSTVNSWTVSAEARSARIQSCWKGVKF